MPRIRVLIVDDEPTARRGLSQLLDQRSDFEIVGQGASGKDLVELISETRPDVVFLDVRMPDMDAFQALDTLAADELPHIVFVSAYQEYAVQAFETHAVDFLLKPFGPDRFMATCDRLKTRFSSQLDPEAGRRLKELLNELAGLLESGGATDDSTTRFAARSQGGIVIVEASDVLWAGAARDYVRLHTQDGSHLIRVTMNELENRLVPEGFVRIHRSTIVRLSGVKKVNRLMNGGWSVVLDDESKHAASRAGWERLQEALGFSV